MRPFLCLIHLILLSVSFRIFCNFFQCVLCSIFLFCYNYCPHYYRLKTPVANNHKQKTFLIITIIITLCTVDRVTSNVLRNHRHYVSMYLSINNYYRRFYWSLKVVIRLCSRQNIKTDKSQSTFFLCFF